MSISSFLQIVVSIPLVQSKSRIHFHYSNSILRWFTWLGINEFNALNLTPFLD